MFAIAEEWTRALKSMTHKSVDSGPQQLDVFHYPIEHGAPELSSFAFWAPASDEEAHSAANRQETAVEAQSAVNLEERIANEARRAFEAGHQKGMSDGRQRERDEQAAALRSAEQQRMQQASELVTNFAQARANYLTAIEEQVVKLALAVAARILRREAQMDPLLLTGAVRVALGHLAASTEVVLKVPPKELELWKETMVHLPGKIQKPQVVAGEGMRPGDCGLETAVGSVDLGLRAQLAEIDQGFFDRVGRESSSAGPRLSLEKTEPEDRACEPAGPSRRAEDRS
jgi:flagellar assembly protein FliH